MPFVTSTEAAYEIAQTASADEADAANDVFIGNWKQTWALDSIFTNSNKRRSEARLECRLDTLLDDAYK